MLSSIRRVSFAMAIVFVSPVAFAQSTRPAVEATPEPILSGRPDASAESAADPAATDMLGDRFDSLSAGIEFRGPRDGTMKRISHGDEFVEFSSETGRWVLKVNRLSFKDPISMTYHQENGHDVNGLMNETIQQLKTTAQNIDIKRNEVVRTGMLDIGMIAGRYSIGAEGNLALVALVRETPSDGAVDASRLYYTFNLTAVVDKPKSGEEDPDAWEKDPRAISAVRMFQQVIDSIRLLDQTSIREDQEQRLFRTRSLLVSVNEAHIKPMLKGEQWLRLLRDNKDIGYTYMVEETGRDLPRSGQRGMQQTGNDDGILIGVRSRTLPESGVAVESESWMWASFDRRHEKWSNLAVVNNAKTGKQAVGDVGSTDTEVQMVADVEPGEHYRGRDGSTKSDDQQPPVRQKSVQTLNVTLIGREKNHEPITRTLPPFYISQAIGDLLPRLVASHQGSTYMFATYNNDAREVMMRYVDVGHEQTVDLDGKSLRAIPVSDKLGLEGSTTVHYISPKGAYIGSVNADQKIKVLVSDADTITNIWKDANLTRPGDVQPPVQTPATPAAK